MKYVEYINFYLQIRNQLEEIRINDITEQVTLDNIHLYFFDELEQYILDGKTSLDVLFTILLENGIDIYLEDNKIKKTYSNYLKIREFLNSQEKKYKYELLKINVSIYSHD